MSLLRPVGHRFFVALQSEATLSLLNITTSAEGADSVRCRIGTPNWCKCNRLCDGLVSFVHLRVIAKGTYTRTQDNLIWPSGKTFADVEGS